MVGPKIIIIVTFIIDNDKEYYLVNRLILTHYCYICQYVGHAVVKFKLYTLDHGDNMK